MCSYYAATHFYLADNLVILGDATVKYQGTWSELKQKPEHILKVDISREHNSTSEETHVEQNVQDDGLRVADAISDLSRVTGDLSLYGK
jgi:ATP-binding cassette, subfamily C (CFTR/MRP), member 1